MIFMVIILLVSCLNVLFEGWILIKYWFVLFCILLIVIFFVMIDKIVLFIVWCFLRIIVLRIIFCVFFNICCIIGKYFCVY